jgi:hypothetical protein
VTPEAALWLTGHLWWAACLPPVFLAAAGLWAWERAERLDPEVVEAPGNDNVAVSAGQRRMVAEPLQNSRMAVMEIAEGGRAAQPGLPMRYWMWAITHPNQNMAVTAAAALLLPVTVAIIALRIRGRVSRNG